MMNATHDQWEPSEANIYMLLNMILIYDQYYARVGNRPLSLRLKPAYIWRYGPGKNHTGTTRIVREA